MKKILFLVGSHRKQSFNHQLAEHIIATIDNRAQSRFLQYENVPFFNEDIEYPIPAALADIKDKIADADGLWIITPEYNGQVPGVLKNLLDWLSRPIEKGNWSKGSIVKNKPVMISSVAGKSAGAYVRSSLASLLKAMRMNLINEQGSGIALNNEHFVSQTLILTQQEKDLFEQQILDFLHYLDEIPD